MALMNLVFADSGSLVGWATDRSYAVLPPVGFIRIDNGPSQEVQIIKKDEFYPLLPCNALVVIPGLPYSVPLVDFEKTGQYWIESINRLVERWSSKINSQTANIFLTYGLELDSILCSNESPNDLDSASSNFFNPQFEKIDKHGLLTPSNAMVKISGSEVVNYADCHVVVSSYKEKDGAIFLNTILRTEYNGKNIFFSDCRATKKIRALPWRALMRYDFPDTVSKDLICYTPPALSDGLTYSEQPHSGALPMTKNSEADERVYTPAPPVGDEDKQ